MDVFSNEMIFYGGLVMTGVSVLLGMIFAGSYLIGNRRLNEKFDIEYGEAPQNGK